MQKTTPTHPGHVVLHRLDDGRWELLGEADRQPGLPACAVRAKAISDATHGRAQKGEIDAAILRSEWRIAQE